MTNRADVSAPQLAIRIVQRFLIRGVITIRCEIARLADPPAIAVHTAGNALASLAIG